MTRLLAAAALSLLVHAPALAAAPIVAAPTTPPVKAQATELARLMVTKPNWSAAMDQMAQAAGQQLQGHPGSALTLPPDFNAKARAEVEKVLPYEELIGLHAKELSALYTDQELGELVTFHKSPLGQKYLQASPQEADRVGRATQERFGQKMPEIMKKLAAGLPQPAGGKKMPAGHPAMGGAPAGHPAPAAAPAKPSKPSK